MQVACLRGGELPVEEQKAWHQQWASSYGIKNPFEQEAKEAKTAEEVTVKKEKPSRRSARSNNRTSTTAVVKAQPSVNMLVRAGENLPGLGELMPGGSSGWQDGKVALVTNNFAHLEDGHVPTKKQAIEGRLALRVGMVVSMRVDLKQKQSSQANMNIMMHLTTLAHPFNLNRKHAYNCTCTFIGDHNAAADIGDWYDLPHHTTRGQEDLPGINSAPPSVAKRAVGWAGVFAYSFVSACAVLSGSGNP